MDFVNMIVSMITSMVAHAHGSGPQSVYLQQGVSIDTDEKQTFFISG